MVNEDLHERLCKRTLNDDEDDIPKAGIRAGVQTTLLLCSTTAFRHGAVVVSIGGNPR